MAPAWREMREGHWYCKLCHCYITNAHLLTKKHIWREAHPGDYGFPIADGVAPVATMPQSTPVPATPVAQVAQECPAVAKCSICDVSHAVGGTRLSSTCASCGNIVCLGCRRPSRPNWDCRCIRCPGFVVTEQADQFIPDWERNSDDEDAASVESVEQNPVAARKTRPAQDYSNDPRGKFRRM